MKTALILAAALVVLIVWAALRLERSMTYHPTRLSGAHPGHLGITWEPASISTPDGESLGAWWCPAEGERLPPLLFFHGNAGTRADRLHNLAGLWAAGFSVLIFDYRGYGDSSGSPSEAGLITDGLAAFDWLAAREPGRPIALFGRSLGGAVAALVARRRPAAALVLESTFTSAPEMAARLLPIPAIRYLTRSRFDALDAVRGLTAPLLVIHGTADELVPFAMGEQLFAAAASARKEFRAVAGGSHNDTYTSAGADYYPWLRDFLAAVEAGKQ